MIDWPVNTPGYFLNASLASFTTYLTWNPPNLIKLLSHTNLFPTLWIPTIFTRSTFQLDLCSVCNMYVPSLWGTYSQFRLNLGY